MLDVDNVEHVNDAYGYLAENTVPAMVPAVVKQKVHPTDLVGRFGGTEFFEFLSGSQDVAAGAFADRSPGGE